MTVDRHNIRNRFGYHPGTSVTAPQHERLREGFIAFAQFLDEILPEGRAKSTTFTNLQQSSMWANFAIAETAPLADLSSSDVPKPTPGTFGPRMAPPKWPNT